MFGEPKIIYKGEEREKTVDGKKLTLVPVTFADCLQMYVGLADKDDNILSYWGFASPRPVLTHIRAAKAVECLDEIGRTDLSGCFKMMNGEQQDELRKRVGEQNYERLRTFVPDNLDDVLLRLRDENIFYSKSEIRKEVEAGNVKESDVVKQVLAELDVEAEEARKAEYGVVIPLEDGYKQLPSVPFLSGKSRGCMHYFLQAFRENIDESKAKAIFHSDSGLQGHYIVAKSKADPAVEITIKAGLMDPMVTSPMPFLEISFEYLGDDVDFSPVYPPKGAEDKRRMSEKFPLLTKEHDARIVPHGNPAKPVVRLDIINPMVERVASAVLQSIEDHAKAAGENYSSSTTREMEK